MDHLSTGDAVHVDNHVKTRWFACLGPPGELVRDPVAQRRLIRPEPTRDRRRRLVAGQRHLHRFMPELIRIPRRTPHAGTPSSGSWSKSGVHQSGSSAERCSSADSAMTSVPPLPARPGRRRVMRQLVVSERKPPLATESVGPSHVDHFASPCAVELKPAAVGSTPAVRLGRAIGRVVTSRNVRPRLAAVVAGASLRDADANW
jgi:hypothetical protein